MGHALSRPLCGDHSKGFIPDLSKIDGMVDLPIWAMVGDKDSKPWLSASRRWRKRLGAGLHPGKDLRLRRSQSRRPLAIPKRNLGWGVVVLVGARLKSALSFWRKILPCGDIADGSEGWILLAS